MTPIIMPPPVTSRALRAFSAQLHPHPTPLLPHTSNGFQAERALLHLRGRNPHVARTARCFSASAKRRKNTLMETSGFAETQLMVRESVGKICGEFGEVSGCGSRSGFEMAGLFLVDFMIHHLVWDMFGFYELGGSHHFPGDGICLTCRAK